MKCPGQDTQYWKAGAIFTAPCPKCAAAVEFFKDDTTRKCGSCGHRFLNPKMDFGCASYCQYAEQCIGDLPPELLAQKEDLLKDRVAIEMKRHFKTDFKKIGRASRAARYAERIGRELGGNLAVIIPAAYLLHVADAAAGTNGESVARDILQRLGARAPLVDAACDIVDAYRPTHDGTEVSAEYLAVFDAERIVDLEEAIKENTAGAFEALSALITNTLLTDAGRIEAHSVLLPHRIQRREV
ncbi:MAG: phosphohydrolase [Pseudomonadota bacterium]